MMRRTAIIAIMCLGLAGFAMAAGEQANVADLVAKMPADTVAGGRQMAAEIVKTGPAGIKQIIAMVVPPGSGDDAKARFALAGVAFHVTRPGAGTERAMYAQALVEAIESDRPAAVKVFLISMLQLVGRNESVAALARQLEEPDLIEPATQALVSIGTSKAGAALDKALPTVKEACRGTIIRALGDLQYKKAAKAILPYAQSQDAAVRRVALYALANIGDPSAADVLAKAAGSGTGFERAHATALYLKFAQRLADTGKKKQCAQICRDLLKSRTGAGDTNVMCNALATLQSALGDDAMEELLAATDNDNRQIRAHALQLINSMPKKSVTKDLVATMGRGSVERQAEVVEAIGQRRDSRAADAVLAALKSPEKAVRLAAVPGVARLDNDKATTALLEAMKTDQADQVKAVQEAILRMRNPQTMTQVAGSLATVPPASRVALLQALASRRAKAQVDAVLAATGDADANVRIAAVRALSVLADPSVLPRMIDLLTKAQDARQEAEIQAAIVAICKRIPDAEARTAPLLAAMSQATSAKRVLFIKPLSQLAGEKALQAIAAETASNDPAIADAAVRALADWPDASAAGELLKIARAAQKETHQVLALRGYARLVGLTSGRPVAQTVEMYQQAAAVAKRPDEKRLVIAGLAKLRDVAALKAIATYLDDETLGAEAALAAVRVVVPENKDEKPLSGPEVIEVMKKIAEVAKDPAVREQAAKYLQAAPKP